MPVYLLPIPAFTLPAKRWISWETSSSATSGLVTPLPALSFCSVISLLCHLDRLRGSEATEREWRDPETASSATLIRGVLPKLRVVCCAQPTMPETKVAARRTLLQTSGLHSLVGVTKCASGIGIR